MFKQANTRKHVREHSWSSIRVVLSTLGHQAHLAQSYFSLIFSAINTYNCLWFNLTLWRIAITEDGGEWWMLTFFPHGKSGHDWYHCIIESSVNRKMRLKTGYTHSLLGMRKSQVAACTLNSIIKLRPEYCNFKDKARYPKLVST